MADYDTYVNYIYTQLEVLDKEGLVLSEATHLVADVGLSSLQVMELIEHIEDHFDISIPLNILPDVNTVGDLARKLKDLNS
jgi:acyl carrier protein